MDKGADFIYEIFVLLRIGNSWKKTFKADLFMFATQSGLMILYDVIRYEKVLRLQSFDKHSLFFYEL